MDEHSAELLFRHKVMRLLQKEGLLSEERTELLLSWRHTGFSVHNRVRVEPEDQPGVERLARYIMRPPISLERMTLPALHIGKGTIRLRSRRGPRDGCLAPTLFAANKVVCLASPPIALLQRRMAGAPTSREASGD